MQKSIVTQRNIWTISSALSEFNRTSSDGSIPVVLIPKDFGRPWQLMVTIPSGVYCLSQTWHKYDGMKSPGLTPFWLGNHRISHVVTKSTITYNAPIRRVPTSDNVMINIDMSLIFQIGPDDQAAYRFVYYLGAHRLDDLLTAQTDESIRGLVYAVPYREIHDLRESFAQNTMRNLNKVLSSYGVVIKSVKVTDVQLPQDLSDTLENTTSFKTKMLEQEKKHENNLRVLLNNEKQNITQVKKHNERSVQNLKAQKERILITRGEVQAVCQSELSVKTTEAESRCAVMIAQAESNKAVAEAQGNKLREELVKRTEMECEARLVQVRQEVASMIMLSKAQLEASISQSQVIREEAEVEEMHAKNLSELRLYEYELERVQIIQNLASKGKMVVSGDMGESVMSQVCPGSKVDKMMAAVHPVSSVK